MYLYTNKDKKCHVQGHVTSTYKVIRQGYSISVCSFEFFYPKNPKYKKNHRSSLYTSRDRKGHVQGHVTLTYKVTCQWYGIGLCSFEFPDPKNPKNKKNHRSRLSATKDRNHVIDVTTSCRHILTSPHVMSKTSSLYKKLAVGINLLHKFENFSLKSSLVRKWQAKNQLGYTCTPGMLPRYFFKVCLWRLIA